MSTRTRNNRLSKPGVAAVKRPARFDRRVEHRRVRRAAHVELQKLTEPEDHALPRPVRTSIKIDPSERVEFEVAKSAPRRKFKVWKTKAWKRRSAARSRRAASYQNLVKSV